MEILEKWWTSLKVTEKESVAERLSGHPCPYPECTEVWNATNQDKKEWIYSHCLYRRGYWKRKEYKGDPFID